MSLHEPICRDQDEPDTHCCTLLRELRELLALTLSSSSNMSTPGRLSRPLRTSKSSLSVTLATVQTSLHSAFR